MQIPLSNETQDEKVKPAIMSLRSLAARQRPRDFRKSICK